jgi:hypothetical protein
MPREAELPTINNTHEMECKKTGNEVIGGNGREIERAPEMAAVPEPSEEKTGKDGVLAGESLGKEVEEQE